MEDIINKLKEIKLTNNEYKAKVDETVKRLKKAYQREMDKRKCSILLKDINFEKKEKQVKVITVKGAKETSVQKSCKAIKKSDGKVCGAKIKGDGEYCGRHSKK
jgi:hypothetical protein